MDPPKNGSSTFVSSPEPACLIDQMEGRLTGLQHHATLRLAGCEESTRCRQLGRRRCSVASAVLARRVVTCGRAVRFRLLPQEASGAKPAESYQSFVSANSVKLTVSAWGWWLYQVIRWSADAQCSSATTDAVPARELLSLALSHVSQENGPDFGSIAQHTQGVGRVGRWWQAAQQICCRSSRACAGGSRSQYRVQELRGE
jgi:hypothetical protein